MNSDFQKVKHFLQDIFNPPMKLHYYKVTVILFLFCIVNYPDLNAQSTGKQKAQFKKATQEFESLHYKEAIKQLSELLKQDNTNVKAQEMLAFSFRMTKDYTGALKAYELLTKQKNIKPEWALYYAEALANNQHYESSEGWYRRYLTLVPADKRASVFTRTNATQFNKNLGNWLVKFTNINTESAEYAPAFYKEGLMFSSNRPTSKLTKRVFLWDNTPFTNLYIVNNLKEIKTLNPDSLKNAVKLNASKPRYKFNDDDTAPTSNDTRTVGTFDPSIVRDTIGSLLSAGIHPFLVKGKVNTKFHEAAPAIFPDGSIIFTRNNYFSGKTQTSLNGINKLKLYTASGQNLSTIEEFPYNHNEYSTGHPTLNQEGTILIFASDMPGGYGGTDLYYCVRSGNGQWTRPINLGKKINTEGNEMFPFLAKNTLYFASTGHAGLGGLDIFEVDLKEMKPENMPKNMGVPINSAKDDFSLIKSNDGKIGYFSSNRRGNDDIYQFKRASNLIILEGTVTDAITRIPLANSRILMRHLDGIDTLKTNAQGKYTRVLPIETDYEMITAKVGYVNDFDFTTSSGITVDTVIKKDIQLSRTELRQQYVLKNCDSLKKVFAIKNIFYDLDRSEIRPDAKPALDQIYNLMKKYPDMSIITSSHCDSRASDSYNRNLSLRRGEAAKAYLIDKGINPSRITVEYYGKTRLTNRCYEGVPCSEADQQLNRRTEFDVVLRGVNLTQLDCNDQ